MSEYPHGKLNDNDQGETPVKIGVENNKLVIEFDYPMKWIGMTKEMALELAEILIRKANLLQGETIQ